MNDKRIRLQLACHGAGFTSEQIIRLEMTLRDVCKHEGLDAESTERVYLALEQMVKKGRIRKDELETQACAFLPAALTALAMTLHCSTSEVRELMDHGLVFADGITMTAFAKSLQQLVHLNEPFRGPPGWMGGRPHAA